jgi:hypothetical protein
MLTTCPHCHSSQVVTRNHARKVGGTLGAIAGAASGFAGAILGGVLGGTAGCSAGATLGELIDEKVLHNYYCLDCQYTFGQASAESTVRRKRSFDASAGGYGDYSFDQDDDEPVALARG